MERHVLGARADIEYHNGINLNSVNIIYIQIQ